MRRLDLKVTLSKRNKVDGDEVAISRKYKNVHSIEEIAKRLSADFGQYVESRRVQANK